MKIIIFKNLADLHEYCAKCLVNQVKSKPNSKIGFATGVSPLETYKLIVEDHKLNKTSWKDVITFNLDEFVNIDPGHKEAFVQQMRTNLFNHLDLQKANIHIPNCQASNFAHEALLYEQLIEQHSPIDLQYISLGINGHMAYNEPGTLFNSKTHVVNLTYETIVDMVNKKKFKSIEDCPKQAITMGVQTILNHTKHIMMVSFGKHKADVTKRMLEDKPNSEITASYLQLHPNCVYILDQAAASLLSKETLKHAQVI